MKDQFKPCKSCNLLPCFGHASGCPEGDGDSVPVTPMQTKAEILVWHWFGTGEKTVNYIRV